MYDFKQHLNPIYKNLEQILDTSNIKFEDQLEESEYPHFINVLKMIGKDIELGFHQMKRLEEQIEHYLWIIDNETGDDKSDAIQMYNSLMVEMEILVERLNRYLDSIDTPYFGKILFERKGTPKFPAREIPAYIGKFAYFDKETNQMMVTDWRAPIANLYYNYSGLEDNVSFESPAGVQTGDLKQKLQLDVSSGRIHNIFDIRSGNVAADEFLLKELDRRIGKKLKDIVSTIQKQQNEIIRDQINIPVIIQGVAGSGKTTILLHRLAYLFYSHRENIHAGSSLIIAPNRLFLDYISDVLPSLGVKGVMQNTYLFWAREILKFTNKHMLDDNESNDVKLFKGSQQFKALLDQYLLQFIVEFFENMPTAVAYDIEEKYQELAKRHADLPFNELVELAIQFTFGSRKIKRREIGDSIGVGVADNDREKQIKKYVKEKLDVYQIYKQFMQSDLIKSERIGIKASKESKAIFSKPKGIKGYSTNDLAPMVLTHLFLYGNKADMYEYIVIDEAQDLSPLQLLSITKYAKNNNFTIAGDTLQSIIPPYHIKDWAPVGSFLQDELKADQLKFHEINRSYRSTVEIIEFANKVLKKVFEGRKLPEAVLRHGDPVKVISSKDQLSDLIEELRVAIGKQIPSIALITKDEAEADAIHAQIKEADLDAPLYSYLDEDFHTGIQVMPVKFAKGLEFDQVIIFNVSKENFSDEDDARLLYVAMTRALHRLLLIHPEDKPSPFLTAL